MEYIAYHTPVMLQECITGLNIKPNGTYVDITFGGGGHSKAILNHLDKGRLFSFDQDADAEAEANSIQHPCFTFIRSNFRFIGQQLKQHEISEVDGILADLGVSSHQFDTPDRGFSIRFDADLDMRMDQTQSLTAKEILNRYTESDLHKIFGMYGEVKNAKTLAKAIVTYRANQKIETTEQLNQLLAQHCPRKEENKYKAQVYQALRIETNDELGALKDFLAQCPELLCSNGRLVVMSYHSLEDRLVKNFILKGKLYGEAEKDMYGNSQNPFSPVFRKAIKPSQEEIAKNGRARSAKLRIASRNPKN